MAAELQAAAAPAPQAPPRLAQAACSYTSCFCEENCWLLIRRLLESGVPLHHLFVAFVSSPSQQVPLWEQRAGGADGFCVWDYHVFVIEQRQAHASSAAPARSPTAAGAGAAAARPQGSREQQRRLPNLEQTQGEAAVWDLDTRLAFPCPLSAYASRALMHGARLPPRFARVFRVVPAELFLRHFSSDRSHMRDDEGRWRQPPPPYPPIAAPDGTTHALPCYLSMPRAEDAVDDPAEVALWGAGEAAGERGEAGSGVAAKDAGGGADGRYGLCLTQRAFLGFFGAGQA